LIGDTSHTPFLAVLVDDASIRVVTHYSSTDLAIIEYPCGQYYLRNCFLSECDPSSLALIQQFSSESNLDLQNLQQASLDATIELSKRIEYWPKPVGLGITLWKDFYQSIITLTNPIGQGDKLELPTIPKPKNPVTGYNFFSSMSRKRVREESPTLTNNELNEVLGNRWKKMNRIQQLPYLEMADADKKRFQEEIAIYTGLVGGVAVLPPRTITAYNIFVQQEKQFVLGFGFEDAKTRIGKHGGDRWQAMSKDEKDLYHVLKDVGV